jgi:hypothetical protein
MNHIYLRFLILAGALAPPCRTASAEERCRGDSASTALADSLVAVAGEALEGHDVPEYASAYANVRRAIRAAPLSNGRWRMILQLARFLNRPDSATAWARLALQHWPQCAIGDTALVQARRLQAELGKP